MSDENWTWKSIYESLCEKNNVSNIIELNEVYGFSSQDELHSHIVDELSLSGDDWEMLVSELDRDRPHCPACVEESKGGRYARPGPQFDDRLLYDHGIEKVDESNNHVLYRGYFESECGLHEEVSFSYESYWMQEK